MTKQQFLESYDRYADALFRYCYLRVFSRARAEELVQDTFLRAWQYASEGKSVENMRAFLYRIATNLMIDNSRKKREESLDALLDAHPQKEPASGDHRHIEENILHKDILKTLELLPAEYREVIVLRYVNDLDPKEIAETMGVSANVISVRLHRGVELVKKRLSL